MDNWDIFIFGVGMVALMIWALYFTTTVVDELRELNGHAKTIKAVFAHYEVQEIAHRTVSISEHAAESKQELKEIRNALKEIGTLLEQLSRQR